MTIDALNQLSLDQAQREFLRCCGSMRWASLMAAARPFRTRDALMAIAERTWWCLDAADWLEAFAAHPRIGERATSAWSAHEQSVAAQSSTEQVAVKLADGNRAYEEKFGYTFLICATGRRADEILSALERRMAASAADELQVAAAEQRKITTLRLEKLIPS